MQSAAEKTIYKSVFVYWLAAFLLFLPSTRFWLVDSWEIVRFESDYFLGYFSGSEGSWSKIMLYGGRLLHLCVFSLIGILFIRLVGLFEKADPSWSQKVLWISILILSLTFLLGIPYVNQDAFFYYARGWQEWRFGTDVYLHTLNSIPNAADYPVVRSVHPLMREMTGNYGAPFQLLAKGLAFLGGDSVRAGFLLFKGLNLIFFLATCRLFLELAKALNLPPVRVLALWGLNPLVLYCFLQGIHNDILMIFFSLLGLYLLLRDRTLLSGMALGIALALKFAFIVLAPLFMAYLFSRNFRTGWKKAMVWGAGAGLMFLGLSLIYPNSIGFFGRIANVQGWGARSSIFIYLLPLGDFLGLSFQQVVKPVQMVFVLLVATILYRMLRRGAAYTPQNLIQDLVMVLLGVLVFVLPGVCEWYLLWAASFAVLLASGLQWRVLSIYTCVYLALSIFTVGKNLWVALLFQTLAMLATLLATGIYFWSCRAATSEIRPDERGSHV